MREYIRLLPEAVGNAALSTLSGIAAETWQAPLFPEISKGTFISRPNRFVLRCKTPSGIIEAYLPNPGRLWELLLPGSIVHLVKKELSSAGKLSHTAVAVERGGTPILLHTHLANAVVARLLAAGKVPGLEGAKITRAEVTVRHSRFDFLLEKDQRPFLLEVKSCSLFGQRLAMFPDAVTARGKRHIEELLAISSQGTTCGIIFLVHWPHADYFLPDYHTDLEFALTFQKMKDKLFIKALSLEWRPDLSLGPNVREVVIPWKTISQEAKDRGSYIIMFSIAADAMITVGNLGKMSFRQGYYLYVDTAQEELSKHIKRHLNHNKIAQGDIEHLRNRAASCLAIPIRSSVPLEQEIAGAVEAIADATLPFSGSSDRLHTNDLYYFADNPLHLPLFMELLQYFRMDRLANIL